MRVEKRPEGIPPEQPIAKAGKRAILRPPRPEDLPKTSGIGQAKRRPEVVVASSLMNALRRTGTIDPTKLKELPLLQKVLRALVHRAGEES
ncbi:MAG: hypothetical protein ACE5GN_07105 [Waddliaceae bacterium]